jgi:agmatine deiminase
MKTLTHILIIVFLGINLVLVAQTIQYTYPIEGAQHEGTWLQWPHSYEYGTAYRNGLDATWVAMTKSLVASEKVHIIAYNNTEKTRITNLLTAAAVSLTNVNFYIHQTNDVWVRDNGPIFVYDNSNNLKILDWDFNGWGGDTPYAKDNVIPQNVSTDLGISRIDLSAMVLEGGAVEHDGKGTFLATKSSFTVDRNSGLTITQIENYLTTNMGFTKFIWLDGKDGGSTEITDQHIDGFARFANGSTIITMSNADLLYWEVSSADITTLNNAKDVNNTPYNFVIVPLTQNDVSTTDGTSLGYKGSYVNYYEANTVILVPNYNDPNDAVANSIIQGQYPGKTVIGVDNRNLFQWGGMVHCVTQQQPAQIITGIDDQVSAEAELDQNNPNPFIDNTTITYTLNEQASVRLEIYNSLGQKIKTLVNSELANGKYSITINSSDFENGIYTYILTLNNSKAISKKMAVIK